MARLFVRLSPVTIIRMKVDILPVEFSAIEKFRDLYRDELHCQIVHDSAHYRPNCFQSHLIKVDGKIAGYGSTWIGNYWMPVNSLFEFYVTPAYRNSMYQLFSELLSATSSAHIYAQTNDPFLGVLIHDFAENIEVEKILFVDKMITSHQPGGAVFRHAEPQDAKRIFEHKAEPVGDWLVEVNGEIVATGGILFHYNRPYGDIFMEVESSFRRRGYGSFLVQELKRICYESGSVPAARTSPTNIASRQTLAKAGFAPCAHIIGGTTKSISA
jgi:GNAT superfamily N-acetyltransferase